MFFSKVIKTITVFACIYIFQASAFALPENQADTDVLNNMPVSEHLNTSPENNRKKFFTDYSLSLGTSMLSKRGDFEEAKFLRGTLNILIGNKKWHYQELYLNFRFGKEVGKKDSSKVLLFETIPRIFYSFPIVGIKSYSGIGLGFGIQPYHTYSKKKDTGKIFAISPQLFTGLKTSNVHKNFGFFIELNMTGTFFPFRSTTDYTRYDIGDNTEPKKSVSLNAGISYHF